MMGAVSVSGLVSTTCLASPPYKRNAVKLDTLQHHSLYLCVQDTAIKHNDGAVFLVQYQSPKVSYYMSGVTTIQTQWHVIRRIATHSYKAHGWGNVFGLVSPKVAYCHTNAMQCNWTRCGNTAMRFSIKTWTVYRVIVPEVTHKKARWEGWVWDQTEKKITSPEKVLGRMRKKRRLFARGADIRLTQGNVPSHSTSPPSTRGVSHHNGIVNLKASV